MSAIASLPRPSHPSYRDICRRKKEASLVHELVKALPLKGLNAEKMTKGVVLRLALQFTKLHKMLEPPEDIKPDITNKIWDPILARSMLMDHRKFFYLLDQNGTVMYVSEQITELLGPQQMDVIGSHMSEMIHPDDCAELQSLLSRTGSSTTSILRMRNTMSPLVRSNEKVKYKAGFVTLLGDYCIKGSEMLQAVECWPLETSGIPEITINAFYEWTMDTQMVITDVGWRAPWVRGFSREELVGKSCVLFIFPEDLDQSSSTQKEVVTEVMGNGVYKGPPMRAVMATGDWLWCRTELTVNTTDSKGRIASFSCKDIVLGKYNYQLAGSPWKASNSVKKASKPSLQQQETRAYRPQQKKAITYTQKVPSPSSISSAASSPRQATPPPPRPSFPVHHVQQVQPQMVSQSPQYCGLKRKYEEYDSTLLNPTMCKHSAHPPNSVPYHNSFNSFGGVNFSSLPSMSDLPNYSPQSASSPSSMQSSAEVSSCSVDAQLQPMAGVEDIFQTLHTNNPTPQSLDPLPELFDILRSNRRCSFNIDMGYQRYH